MIRAIKSVAGTWHFWIVVGVFILATILQYPQQLPIVGGDAPRSLLGTERHAAERLIFLLPIAYAGLVFGIRGGIAAVFMALALMVPRDIWISEFPIDAALETGTIILTGVLANVLFEAYRRQRIGGERMLSRLQAAQEQLRFNLNVIERRESELAAVNSVSAVVSESLEIKDILARAASRVRDVIGMESFLAFLLEEATRELVLEAYEGVSDAFASGISRMAPGEGLNIARVTESAEPWLIDLDEKGLGPAPPGMEQEGIRVSVVVPIKFKGDVLGVLCLCARQSRQFRSEQVELLATLGNVVGVALENARLFQEQRQTAEALRASEKAYRELFENAHDAIIFQDLDGKIAVTNAAALKLGDYAESELIGRNVREVLTPGGLEIAREVKRRLLQGEVIDRAYDQQFIKKDGSLAYVKLTTSLVSDGRRPKGFQHIARDVTDEKRLEENLRFYLREATRAQEEERKRIARDLHDETAQELVALSRELDKLAIRFGRRSENARARIRELQDWVGKVLDGVRRFGQDLRPSVLDDLGLLPALQWLAADIEKRFGIEVRTNVVGDERRLPPDAELLLFRIAQEALHNVWRHSGASRASLVVEFEDDTVRLSVRDNGTGFEVPERAGDLAEQGKLGLAGMQERARLLGATLNLESKPGEGTTVSVETAVHGPELADA
jgi:PAS domain S-box-containing protein